jgi:hypothetical protein
MSIWIEFSNNNNKKKQKQSRTKRKRKEKKDGEIETQTKEKRKNVGRRNRASSMFVLFSTLFNHRSNHESYVDMWTMHDRQMLFEFSMTSNAKYNKITIGKNRRSRKEKEKMKID